MRASLARTLLATIAAALLLNMSGGPFGTAVTAASSSLGASTSTVAPCSASALSATGGRQGENMGTSGTIVLTNETGQRCRLSGIARLSLVGRSGATLDLAYRRPINRVRALVLPAGSSAEIVVSWWNWCGPAPGRLAVRVALPGRAGSLVAPFDGPPADQRVPECLSCKQRSWLAVDRAFEPYLPAEPTCVRPEVSALRMTSGSAIRLRVGQLVEVDEVEPASFLDPRAYPAAISPWEAARSSNVFVVEPVERCRATSTLGERVYVSEFRAVAPGRVVLSQPLAPVWRAVHTRRPAAFRATIAVVPARAA